MIPKGSSGNLCGSQDLVYDGRVSAREDVFDRLVPWLQVSASSCAVLWAEMYLAFGLSLLNRIQM